MALQVLHHGARLARRLLGLGERGAGALRRRLGLRLSRQRAVGRLLRALRRLRPAACSASDGSDRLPLPERSGLRRLVFAGAAGQAAGLDRAAGAVLEPLRPDALAFAPGREHRHRVGACLGLALQPARHQQLADVVVDRGGVERGAHLLLRARTSPPRPSASRAKSRTASRSRGGRLADRPGVAVARQQRLVRLAQRLARGQEVVGAVLADGSVDRCRRDARAPQRLHRVGLVAALLAPQPLRERVAGGRELVVGQPVELVGLVDHDRRVRTGGVQSV